MYYAVAHERPQLVKMLLDAGYDVNHKEKDSERLLHISVRSLVSVIVHFVNGWMDGLMNEWMG